MARNAAAAQRAPGATSEATGSWRAAACWSSRREDRRPQRSARLGGHPLRGRARRHRAGASATVLQVCCAGHRRRARMFGQRLARAVTSGRTVSRARAALVDLVSRPMALRSATSVVGTQHPEHQHRCTPARRLLVSIASGSQRRTSLSARSLHEVSPSTDRPRRGTCRADADLGAEAYSKPSQTRAGI